MVLSGKKWVRIAIALLVVLVVNVLAAVVFFRLDLTSEKRFSLNENTQVMLEGLTDDIQITVYLSGDELPSQFGRMHKAIDELLNQFKSWSGRKVLYSFVNPTANENKEARFARYKELNSLGIAPFEVETVSSNGQSSQVVVFPGASIAMGDKKMSVNLLKTDARYAPESEENINNSVQSLEYEFSNAIRKLIRKTKPQIAFIEGHGELSELQVLDVTHVLSEYYDVRRGRMGGKEGILNDFAAVIVAAPQKGFSNDDKYVLDQYIMHGGKVLWMLDGAQAVNDSTDQSVLSVMANEVNLQDLLFRYGVRVNYDLIQDLQSSPVGLATGGEGGTPRIKLFDWTYFPILVTTNNHVINKYLGPIRSEFISTIDTTGNSPKVRKTELLFSSRFTKLQAVPLRIDLKEATQKPDESQFTQSPLPVAALLEGEFESAFKNRPVSLYTTQPQLFKSESVGTKMIVVADGSIIRNEVSAEGKDYPAGFDIHSQKFFKGNREFILNCLNYLCEEDGLMRIRNRELQMRLLDKKRVVSERVYWQIINVVLPILVFLSLGVLWFFVRRKMFG
jgi:ABC-2 type transport system permease protein